MSYHLLLRTDNKDLPLFHKLFHELILPVISLPSVCHNLTKFRIFLVTPLDKLLYLRIICRLRALRLSKYNNNLIAPLLNCSFNRYRINNASIQIMIAVNFNRFAYKWHGAACHLTLQEFIFRLKISFILSLSSLAINNNTLTLCLRCEKCIKIIRNIFKRIFGYQHFKIKNLLILEKLSDSIIAFSIFMGNYLFRSSFLSGNIVYRITCPRRHTYNIVIINVLLKHVIKNTGRENTSHSPAFQHKPCLYFAHKRLLFNVSFYIINNIFNRFKLGIRTESDLKLILNSNSK